MMTDDNQTYCGDHFVIYTNIKYNVVCQLYLNLKIRTKFPGLDKNLHCHSI